MSLIPIYKYSSLATTPATFLEKLEAVTDSIRNRAFDLFEKRNGSERSAMDDWLQAERDVVLAPAAELVDNDKEFHAQIAIPGFDAKDVQVSALPDALIVQAENTHSHQGKDGNVQFCEFSGKQLFRRIDLPASVDVDKVSASLDKGILQVTAPKAAPKQLAATA